MVNKAFRSCESFAIGTLNENHYQLASVRGGQSDHGVSLDKAMMLILVHPVIVVHDGPVTVRIEVRMIQEPVANLVAACLGFHDERRRTAHRITVIVVHLMIGSVVIVRRLADDECLV